MSSKIPAKKTIQRVYVTLFVLLTLVYLGFSFLISPTPAALHQYHITATHARVITVSVVIPLVIIWLIGLYGSLKMKGYSLLIKESPEGKALDTLSNGLLVLVMSLPLTSDLGSLVGLIGRHAVGWLPTLTIINNYLQILLMAAGLILVASGAQRFSSLARKKAGNGWEQQAWVLGFIIFSTLYSYFLVLRPLHTAGGPKTYYMADWLVLLTIAVPYLFFWYRGLYAAYSIYRYQKNVRGYIYKGSLIYVAAGITAVILSSVFVRVLTTVSYKLSRLSLTPILFIIYGFLILTAIGYLLIAWGAKKLRQIEEV